MKKLFALMLALMLALGCVSFAGAEDAAAPEVVEAVPAAAAGSSGTINLRLKLNPDGITAIAGAAGESAAQQIKPIVELVNALVITMTSDGKDAEMIITANDTAVAGLGVIRNDGKMLLVSDLFPKYALAIDQQAMGGAASAAGGFTMPQISMSEEQAAALMAPFAKVGEQLQAKIGEPETVEETMYGATFTVKTPINLTTKELLEIVMPAVKEVISQEAFTSVIDQMKAQGMNVNFSAEEINKKIDELLEKKDEELPALDASLFSNEAGDSMFILHLDKDSDSVAVHSGTAAGKTVVEVNVGTKFYLMLERDTENVALKIQAAPNEGMLIDIDGAITATAEAFNATFDVKLNETELGTVLIDGTPGGVLSGSYTAEGKEEISIAELQDQQSEKMKAFMSNMQVGVMMLMGKIAQAVPSFAEFIQQMSQPQAAPEK